MASRKYFYRISYFKPSRLEVEISQENKKLDDYILKALEEGNGLMLAIAANAKRQVPKAKIPEKFSHGDYDIRTWTHTNEFVEVDKDTYSQIVKDEKKILQHEGVKEAGLQYWHCPLDIESDNHEKYLKNKFNLEEIKIRYKK